MNSHIICNGSIEDEERTGWMIECPNCSEQVRYTVLRLSPGKDVYLYCNRSSDFILRDEDSYAAQLIEDRFGKEYFLDELRRLYEDLERNLPESPGGGNFKIWSNVKCPHCSYEFPYNNNIRNESARFMESALIWVEGAVAYRGGSRSSNRLARVKVVS